MYWMIGSAKMDPCPTLERTVSVVAISECVGSLKRTVVVRSGTVFRACAPLFLTATDVCNATPVLAINRVVCQALTGFWKAAVLSCMVYAIDSQHGGKLPKVGNGTF